MKTIKDITITIIVTIICDFCICWFFYPEVFQNGINRRNWKMFYNWQLPLILVAPFAIFLIAQYLYRKIKEKKNKYKTNEIEYPSYIQNGEKFYKIGPNGERHEFEQWELDAEIQSFYRDFLSGIKLKAKQLMLVRWYIDTFPNPKWKECAIKMFNSSS